MSLFLFNCRLIEPAGVRLFFLPGTIGNNLIAVVGAVGKVKIPLPWRDFQAEWESPAFGLFREAAFPTALLPTNSAIPPRKLVET